MSQDSDQPDRVPAGAPSGKPGWVLAVLLVAFVGVGAAAVWLARGQGGGASALPILGQLPPFALTGQQGETVRRDDLAGHPWVADFIFTRCAGSCPLLTRRMGEVADALPRGSSVRLVSITVDPAHDTPEVLAAYARRHGAGPGWWFLTGERKAIYELSISGFKLGVEASPEAALQRPDEPIVHSTRLVLVDGAARIRGYYDAFDDAELARLLRNLRAVDREPR